jgi:hypothetical protein
MTDLDIIARYPNLFDLSGGSRSQMQWGFQGVGPGWLGIMDRLCDELQSIAEPQFRCVSVKSKQGTFRLNYRGGNEVIEKLVEAAKAEALVTCEECGSPGMLEERDGGFAVRCGRCAVE